jgi:hypothetical protein
MKCVEYSIILRLCIVRHVSPTIELYVLRSVVIWTYEMLKKTLSQIEIASIIEITVSYWDSDSMKFLQSPKLHDSVMNGMI